MEALSASDVRTLEMRVAALDSRIATTKDVLLKLDLIQRRQTLRAELATLRRPRYCDASATARTAPPLLRLPSRNVNTVHGTR